MNFGIIILNQSIKTMQNCVTWILAAVLLILKLKDFYEDIANDVEKFDSSNYEVYKPLPTGKKKMIGLMKDELGEKIMKEFLAIRPKTYSYLADDGNNDKKANGTNKHLIDKILKNNYYKYCLFNGKPILQLQQRFKSEAHNMCTEEINKIALSSNNDKRLQTFDNITTYLYGTSVGKVYKTELLSK